MTGKDDNDTSPLDDGGDWIDRDDDNAPGPVIDRDEDEAFPVDPPPAPRSAPFPEERDYPEVPEWDDEVSDPDSLPDWDAPSADNDDLNRLAARELADLDEEPYPVPSEERPPPLGMHPEATVGSASQAADDVFDPDSSNSLEDSGSNDLEYVSDNRYAERPLDDGPEEGWRDPDSAEASDDSWSDDSDDATAVTYRSTALDDTASRAAPPELALEPAADEAASRRWPVAMLAIAAIAVVLLAVGGYGVISERSALQAEIRQLQSQLATAVSPEEARASRDAQQAVEQQNTALEAEIRALRSENSELQQALDDLEASAEADAKAAEEAIAAAKAAAVSRSTASAPAASAGDWFVNFGSYANAAVAKRWASRLQVDSGSVVVQDAQSGGETLYRVRVVGLAGKSAADRVARELETEHKLPKLWVGKD